MDCRGSHTADCERRAIHGSASTQTNDESVVVNENADPYDAISRHCAHPVKRRVGKITENQSGTKERKMEVRILTNGRIVVVRGYGLCEGVEIPRSV